MTKRRTWPAGLKEGANPFRPPRAAAELPSEPSEMLVLEVPNMLADPHAVLACVTIAAMEVRTARPKIPQGNCNRRSPFGAPVRKCRPHPPNEEQSINAWRAATRTSPVHAPGQAHNEAQEEEKQTPFEYQRCAMELEEMVGGILELLGIEPEQGEVASEAPRKEWLRSTLCNLRLASNKLHHTYKVLNELATCPVTLQFFQRPVLAPDGHSYERSAIRKWLQLKGASPVTRDPMRISQLLRNRPLERLAGLMCGQEDAAFEDDDATLEEEDETEPNASLQASPPIEVVYQVQQAIPFGIELITAIETEEEETALALARGHLDTAVLNCHHGDQHASVLHLALLHGMPDVAVALLDQSDSFHFQLFMGSPQEALSALHLAAALGSSSFCEAFLRRSGALYAGLPVLADIQVRLSNGEEVRFYPGERPAEIAWRRGHRDLYRLISAALAEIDYDAELRNQILAR